MFGLLIIDVYLVNNFRLQDVQLCPLYLGSCTLINVLLRMPFHHLSSPVAYTHSEVVYRWNAKRQIVIAPGMKMSQFDLVLFNNPFFNAKSTYANRISPFIRSPIPFLTTLCGLDTVPRKCASESSVCLIFFIFRQLFYAVGQLQLAEAYGFLSYTRFNGKILLFLSNIFKKLFLFPFKVYGPCILLVVLSWVSFWLNREATADRYLSIEYNVEIIYRLI